MCLMLYVASSVELPQLETPELSIEKLKPENETIRQWLSPPIVNRARAHTGCSCGFPTVVAEAPIEYYDGLFADNAEKRRALDLASIRALLDLIARCLGESEVVELYPVWNGYEPDPPKGTINFSLRDLTPERFFFTEQFLHRITA